MQWLGVWKIWGETVLLGEMVLGRGHGCQGVAERMFGIRAGLKTFMSAWPVVVALIRLYPACWTGMRERPALNLPYKAKGWRFAAHGEEADQPNGLVVEASQLRNAPGMAVVSGMHPKAKVRLRSLALL